MKIALIGPKDAGKTSYISALYLMFRNIIASPPLTRSQKIAYEKFNINTHVGFRLSVGNADIDRELGLNANLMSKDPIEFPKPTKYLEKADLSAQFDFIPLNGHADGVSRQSYTRKIDLFDPPGEAFSNELTNSEAIIDDIAECDCGMVFFPVDIITDELSGKSVDDLSERQLKKINQSFALGGVAQALSKMNNKFEDGDIFPVCFVLTKCDLIPQGQRGEVLEFMYDQLLAPFSSENKNLLVCIIPIHVQDPKENVFQSFNIEWPFLFSAWGIILRKAKRLMRESASAVKMGELYERQANRLQASNWAVKLWTYISDGDTSTSLRTTAREYASDAQDLTKLAEEEKELASHIQGCISNQFKYRDIGVLMNGRGIRPELPW
jgi:GTPase SAR1 family protein